MEEPLKSYTDSECRAWRLRTPEAAIPGIGSKRLGVPFTRAEVKAAVALLANGRASGDDLVINEALKHASDDMLDCIVGLFNLARKAETVPSEWRIGRVAAVYKGKNSEQDWANYRYIVVTSCICKLYERLWDSRQRAWLDPSWEARALKVWA